MQISDYLTVSELSRRTGLSRTAVRDLAIQHNVDHISLAKTKRYSLEGLLKALSR